MARQAPHGALTLQRHRQELERNEGERQEREADDRENGADDGHLLKRQVLESAGWRMVRRMVSAFWRPSAVLR